MKPPIKSLHRWSSLNNLLYES